MCTCIHVRCVRHSKKCPVKSTDVFTCGFSCKSLSKMNSSTMDKHTLLGKILSNTSSASTFRGTMKYIVKHKPKIVILENVDAVLADEDGLQGNCQTVTSSFDAANYALMTIRINTKLYALPQDRLRIYFIAYHKDSNMWHQPNEYSSIFEQISKSMQSMCRDPPCALSVLRAMDGDLLANMLQQKVAASTGPQQNPAETTWPAQHMAWFASKGLRWGTVKPRASTRESAYYKARWGVS